MIGEELIKTELTALASDLMKVVEEIDKRKAEKEEWLAELAKQPGERGGGTVVAGVATRGLQRELNYIHERMENVLDYIAQPAPGSMI